MKIKSPSVPAFPRCTCGRTMTSPDTAQQSPASIQDTLDWLFSLEAETADFIGTHDCVHVHTSVLISFLSLCRALPENLS